MAWLVVLQLACLPCGAPALGDLSLGHLSLQGTDCNRSGIDDAVEIESGLSLDCNDNALPDECELPPPSFALQERPTGIEVKPELRALHAVDLTGDGLSDLLEVYRVGSRLTGLAVHHASGGWASGDGTFTTAVEHEIPGVFGALKTADLDADGDPDVVVTTSGGLVLFYNTTGLSSDPPELVPLSPYGALAVGQLTGGELPDLVVGARRTLVLVENAGPGAFQPVHEWPLEFNVESVVLADLNSDGRLDLAASGTRPGELAVLIQLDGGGGGGGGGRWDSPTRYATKGRRLLKLYVGDLNRDGDPELILSTFDGLSVLWNRAGRFDTLETLAQPANTLILDDVDDDGDLDLVAGDLTTQTITPVLSDGAGGLAPALSWRIPHRPGAVAVGEFNGVLGRDIVASEDDGSGVSLLRRGERTNEGLVILRPRPIPLDDNPHSATVADFNGDGVLDVIESGGHAGRMVTRLSEGNVPFFNKQNYQYDDALRLFSIDNGDFDRDGDQDIVMADSEQHELKVLTNRGDGVFENPVDHAVLRAPMIVFVHDVDGDDWLDLVSAASADNSATVLFGGEDGAFASRRTDAKVGTNPLAVTAVDLDGDGRAEVVVPNFTSRDMSILRNLDGRSFAPQEVVLVLGQPRYVTSLDADDGGLADIVLASADTNDISVFLNDGAGGLAAPVSYPLGHEPYSVRPGDVDGDGVLDLITGNWRADSISVLRGSGEGSFLPPDEYAVGLQPRFVLPGDFDRDGDLDLVSANYASRDLTWLVHFQAYGLDAPYLTGVCTEFEFSELADTQFTASGRLRFLVPRNPDAKLPLLFENTRTIPTQREFLVNVFPELFGDLTEDSYRALVAAEGGSYRSGVMERIVRPEGVLFGFGLATESLLPEATRLGALQTLYTTLREGFSLGPLAYLPEDKAALETARGWGTPDFPVVGIVPGVVFRRGDVRVDGRVNLQDVVAIVETLFGDAIATTCLAAADTNGDGQLAVTDAVRLLGFIFLGEKPPAPPSTACGLDPTVDGLGCAVFEECEG